MTVETAAFIGALNASYPANTDPKSEGDDHLRLIKAAILASFPGITAAMTATHTELNYAVGVTSALHGVNQTATVTNKTINLTSNTLTGTVAQFNTALSDDNFATLTNAVTLTNKTLDNAVFTGEITEEVYAVSGTTPALDPANGTIQTWTLTGNSSPSDSIAAGQTLTLMIDDGTAYAITWPTTTWKTDGGLAPSLNASGYTVVVLWKVATTLYGARVGNA